ncbi:porin [Rhodoferax sediminis]|uniref:Porin n=1 Tax=Rhodoferax sediminis TaxID=2509614 RepID=A0A515D7F2_9BURK|nr:porin [Rhodoferax sediminis]QDL36353.1 porin [Rhodoferax sediminis]
MKKSLVALAALAFVGVASAQSSVTLFGVVDAAYEHVSGSALAGSVNGLVQGANSSSRLGFRGTEDLGGGLNAGFWLEAGLNNDSGSGANTSANNQTSQNSGGGLTFNRRSTVSLAGNFGEIRLGRDYTPSFWNDTIFDPFGTVGVGAATNATIALGGANGIQTTVRSSNSIGYFLPGNLGGFYGQAMYAMGENSSNATAGGFDTSKNGNVMGGRIGYANGPLNVAASYSQTKIAALDNYKKANIGVSYDLGVVALMAQYNQEKLGAPGAFGAEKNTTWLLGLNAPVGPGNIVASYNRAKFDNNAVKADQYALGYVYNLSKRTALYGTYAHVKNNGTSANVTAGALAGNAGASGVIGSSNGFDLGLRHTF